MQALGVRRGAFLDAAERLQRRGVLLSPRRDFYVVVPPQFASWGAPPPAWYIDALMRHEGQPYYVGLLKAAELHGATHQAVMEFQIVTAKRLPDIRAGRGRIVFYYRKDMTAVEGGIESHKTDTGTMRIFSPALTALDLLRYPQAVGGIDAIATVLADLPPKIDPAQLATLSKAAERPVVQRLGHLLERLGHPQRIGIVRAVPSILKRRLDKARIGLRPLRLLPFGAAEVQRIPQAPVDHPARHPPAMFEVQLPRHLHEPGLVAGQILRGHRLRIDP